MPTTAMDNKNNNLPAKTGQSPTTPPQRALNLNIEKEAEIAGVGMGVLTDGTPYLTQRGLARLCGLTHSVISEITAEWNTESRRITAIKDLARRTGLTIEHPCIEIIEGGVRKYLYSAPVCMVFLEYYALDAGANVKEEARKNFRLFAHKALRDFILTQVGYDPKRTVPDIWRQFHDRVSLTYNSVPQGFFCVFKEISDMVVTLGQNGLQVDSKFVPDISVGQAWANYWTTNELDHKYGQRQKFDHHYPDYFPQAASNPQPVWSYPEEALGDFRRWMRESYIGGGKFEKYLEGQIKKRELPPSFAQLALAAYGQEVESDGSEFIEPQRRVPPARSPRYE